MYIMLKNKETIGELIFFTVLISKRITLTLWIRLFNTYKVASLCP
jgi:hypothetical protein